MAASLALGALVGALLAGPGQGPSGIVVESVAAGSAAEKAGLVRGDRITSWSQGSDSSPVSSPFDLEDVELERAPRGLVSLSVSRASDSRLVVLGEGAWGIRARPELSQPELSILEDARAASRDGRPEEAGQGLAGLATKVTDMRVASWLHVESASAWGAGKRWEEAQSQYEAALADLGPRAAAAVWIKRGGAQAAANSLSGAKHAYEEALRILETVGHPDLRYAESLKLLTSVLGPQEAVAVAHHASSLAEALAPESLFLARLSNNEAVMNYILGDLDRATALLERAHGIAKRKAPGTPLEVPYLINIGVFATQRGDLATAEDSLRRATRILDAAATEDSYHASAYFNLGSVLAQRGDLEAAEDATKRSIEIARSLPTTDSASGVALANLAALAAERGDPTRAEDLALQAATLLEGVGRRWLGGPLGTLGALALARGEIDRAEDLFRRASLHWESGSAHVDLAVARLGLGDVARARGDRAAAAALYQVVADAHSKWRPGSFQEAEALGRLASLQAEDGRPAEAAALYARAVEALERQRQSLGPGQERGARRMADYSRIYSGYVDVLLSLRRPEEAFHVVEASRARALVDLLTQRDLGFERDIPAELATERRRIKVSYDRVLAELDQVDTKADPQAAEKLSAQLRDLQEARLRLAAEIRKASPRLAEIDNPQPVSVAEARRALDAGTVLLSYLVGERKTVLFAVEGEGGRTHSPGGIASFEIAAGREELREKIGAFLALLRDRSAEPAAISAAAEDLYRLLVAPAEGLVSGSSRILVSPDGPLQVLPFAALAQPSVPGRRSSFLAERLPIHTIASATLYAELRQRRAHPGAAVVIAAFGDPVYPKGSQATGEVALRSGVRGRSLSPLPGTGREVREIARLFPKRAKAFLGSEATEENAKALSADTRYVHFGCHALLNARSPLDSGLVLSLPEAPTEGRDNGILQAWEIFEDLRLDADIVTLSACESGLGTEVGGEGLVGLTRAFQYAGARSVLASLWNVADDSTAELMGLFYRNLKQGKSKDRALQHAQVEMIHRGYSPFHWAAFQLTGDWK